MVMRFSIEQQMYCVMPTPATSYGVNYVGTEHILSGLWQKVPSCLYGVNTSGVTKEKLGKSWIKFMKIDE